MHNFIEFIRSRGIIGFAIGFICGKAVSDLVNAFVSDLINPVVGLVLGRFKDLSSYSFTIASSTIKYGDFASVILNFVVITLAVYFIFKVIGLERLDEQKK